MSGATEGALRAQAERLRAYAAGGAAPDLAGVGHALATTRAALPHRAVVVGPDRDTLVTALGELALGRDTADGLVRGTAFGGETAFLFSGQG
ncbi:CurL C-terminal domain-containing protein, partial [Streptomyces marinisediminis]|uniref:CurL C-terminal domain-containing protein n=1 Tax=Streptomyces marinisediminis TaxID=2984864 RepID=UPI002249992B